METTQRIFLYSYLYLKLAKMPCFSYLTFMFFQQNQRIRGWNRFFPKEGQRGEVVQIMSTYVSKCKNDTC
jgi:hypothetical protein